VPKEPRQHDEGEQRPAGVLEHGPGAVHGPRRVDVEESHVDELLAIVDAAARALDQVVAADAIASPTWVGSPG
jgi:hypothetical protein